ncbi:MAG: hypothetical protein KIH63_001460 [Candidatus Saccharibacteria bacterium]|nr:hypothetical protein [Candidatus Saccharibacteria bacterium]
MPLESAKPFGMLSMLVTVAVVIGMLAIWPHEKGKSISRHSAAGRVPYLLMALVQTFAYPAYLWFAFQWFVPTFDINPLYLVLTVLSAIGLLVAAWVPDVPGIRRRIHEVCAYGAAGLYIPATLILVLTPTIVPMARVFGALTAAYMIINVYAGLKIPKAHEYHLPLQSIYIVSYFAVILLATYVR